MPNLPPSALIAAPLLLILGIWLASLAPSAEVAWVLGLLLLTVYLFAFEVLRVDVAAVGILVLLGLLSSAHDLIGLTRPLVPAAELFQGLASNAVVSIIGVMIIGAGLDKTGLMNQVAGAMLKLAGRTEARIIPAVSGTVGLISGFMQNVGAAALFLPVVGRIAARTGIPLSRLLMPMGFCAILGGTLTLVVSSPLILLNDLLLSSNKALPPEQQIATWSLFSVTPIGLALLASGIAYFVVASRYVLPSRRHEEITRATGTLHYFQELYGLDYALSKVLVPAGAPLVGQTLDEVERAYRIRVIAVRHGGLDRRADPCRARRRRGLGSAARHRRTGHRLHPGHVQRRRDGIAGAAGGQHRLHGGREPCRVRPDRGARHLECLSFADASGQCPDHGPRRLPCGRLPACRRHHDRVVHRGDDADAQPALLTSAAGARMTTDLPPRTLAGLLGLLLVFLLVTPSGIHADDRPQPELASGFTPRPVTVGKRYMAVTANAHATQAAVEMLARGGSAVDAAIAAQLVLNVVEPQSSGIGGGGFLLHYDRGSGQILAYDGRETAPATARPDRFQRAEGQPQPFGAAVTGGMAVGVPGLVAMLAQAHAAHGRLPWADLFAPAIRLAEAGFPVSPRLNHLLARDAALPHDPQARRLFYDAARRPLPVGARLRNPELAGVLRRIAAGGASNFYAGELARDIVATVRNAPSHPGDLTMADLAAYRPKARAPVCTPYRGFRVCSMPPPAGGVTLLQILGLLDHFEPRHPEDAMAVHRFAEAGRLAYADRAHYLADPDFVAVPVARLLDPGYLATRARLIRDEASLGRAAPGELPAASATAGAGIERPATTHLSVVDADGNAVALTSSIEDAFGSRLMVQGFLLNNQLTDFAFRPVEAGHAVANRVEGGKRPLSAMSPTLVLDREGRLYAVLGSPGGGRIINYVARAVVALIDGDLTLDEVVRLPHAGSRNGPTELERDRAPPALAEALRRRGHEIVEAEMTSGLHLIVGVDGQWIGAADPRREGYAAGE